MGGATHLAALALAVLHAGSAAASCGCAQFALDAGAAGSGQAVLSAGGRSMRDFVLFSHRRIGADLIRRHGPYLSTLTALFPHCPDDALKLAWLRQAFAGTSDTRLFAERIAQQYDSASACPLPAR